MNKASTYGHRNFILSESHAEAIVATTVNNCEEHVSTDSVLGEVDSKLT